MQEEHSLGVQKIKLELSVWNNNNEIAINALPAVGGQ